MHPDLIQCIIAIHSTVHPKTVRKIAELKMQLEAARARVAELEAARAVEPKPATEVEIAEADVADGSVLVEAKLSDVPPAWEEVA